MTEPLLYSLLAAGPLAVACALLSVVVVARRWAFLGEGISHAGFGGAGTAWLAAILWPTLDTPATAQAGIALFCLATGLAIGALHRRQRINADAAIGIFLVASLAWGFLAQQAYAAARGKLPAGWDAVLFGHLSALPPAYALLTAVLSVAVVLILALLRKEILYYCLDPMMAEASGVQAGFIHYLLIILQTITIILGVRIAGSVLVTALLVLPGATASLLCRRMGSLAAASVAVGLTGALSGVLVHHHWRIVPQGPAIVLSLFVLFLAALTLSRTKRGRN